MTEKLSAAPDGASDGKARFKQGSKTRAHEMKMQPLNKKSAEFRDWYRGEHTNKNPHLAELMSLKGLDRYVLKGFAPEAPLIKPDTRITAFGSCFASNVSNYLAQRGFSVAGRDGEEHAAYVIRCGEGMVNTFVIRQQFEWAWENKTFDGELWHGYNAESYGYDEKVRLATKAIFDETDVFILTLGLSEVWYDEPTDNVFWRTIPKDVYDPERHKFRVSSVEENKDNIAAICALIRKHRPDAHIFLTLSPIPLIATFRDQACMASNEVSKAVLRVAIDEYRRENPDMAHYWPSYEIVRHVFAGSMADDMRHPDDWVIHFIMGLFEVTWCDGGNKVDLLTRLGNAFVSSRDLPPRLGRAFKRREREVVQDFLNRAKVKHDPKTDRALKRLLAGILEEWDTVPHQDLALY